jgi:hypothetical protein
MLRQFAGRLLTTGVVRSSSSSNALPTLCARSLLSGVRQFSQTTQVEKHPKPKESPVDVLIRKTREASIAGGGWKKLLILRFEEEYFSHTIFLLMQIAILLFLFIFSSLHAAVVFPAWPPRARFEI